MPAPGTYKVSAARTVSSQCVEGFAGKQHASSRLLNLQSKSGPHMKYSSLFVVVGLYLASQCCAFGENFSLLFKASPKAKLGS